MFSYEHGVCPMHFDSMNITSELIILVEEKIKQFNFKLYSSNDPFILLYYFNYTINIVSHETIRFVTMALL